MSLQLDRWGRLEPRWEPCLLPSWSWLPCGVRTWGHRGGSCQEDPSPGSCRVQECGLPHAHPVRTECGASFRPCSRSPGSMFTPHPLRAASLSSKPQGPSVAWHPRPVSLATLAALSSARGCERSPVQVPVWFPPGVHRWGRRLLLPPSCSWSFYLLPGLSMAALASPSMFP